MSTLSRDAGDGGGWEIEMQKLQLYQGMQGMGKQVDKMSTSFGRMQEMVGMYYMALQAGRTQGNCW